MRYKVVPSPADEARLLAVRDAVPLVPGSVADCCTRIRDRTDLPARDVAREWLTFCEALGLVADTDRGYYRVRDGPDRAARAEAFTERVLGARELLEALSEEPTGADAAFGAVRAVVPRYERDRYPDWEREWRDRTDRLLAWAVELGLAERVEGGYRRAPDRPA